MAVEAKEEMHVNAWRISAKRESGTRVELGDADEDFMFASIKPGDALLLMDESGECAWGVRRAFLVRREVGRSIVYFDRGRDFEPQGVDFAGSGDRTALRKIDLAVVDQVLQAVHPPHPGEPGNPDDEDCLGWTFAGLEEDLADDSDADRANVRRLLELIVKDDLLGPALGPEEEIVGMNVRDRYILGRLGPRKENGSGATQASTSKELAANEEVAADVGGNDDHIDRDQDHVAATDIAEEEPEEDVADNNVDITRSSSLVPSSMGLTFCIDENLPDV